jgi:hypothetical protein
MTWCAWPTSSGSADRNRVPQPAPRTRFRLTSQQITPGTVGRLMAGFAHPERPEISPPAASAGRPARKSQINPPPPGDRGGKSIATPALGPRTRRLLDRRRDHPDAGGEINLRAGSAGGATLARGFWPDRDPLSLNRTADARPSGGGRRRRLARRFPPVPTREKVGGNRIGAVEATEIQSLKRRVPAVPTVPTSSRRAVGLRACRGH